MGINELVEISNFYGVNPDYVLAGGGNTSFKDNEYLYVKGSGTTLALSLIHIYGQIEVAISALKQSLINDETGEIDTEAAYKR